MTTHTRVVLEAYPGGRPSTTSLDDAGYGGGYRICGPKFIDAIVETETFGAPPLKAAISHQLDASDVDGIRCELRTFDLIHSVPDEFELRQLTAAADQYRHALRLNREYWDLPHQVERREQLADQLAEACLALADALTRPETTS